MKLEEIMDLDKTYRERMKHYQSIRCFPGVEKILHNLEIQYNERVLDAYKINKHYNELGFALAWYLEYKGWLGNRMEHMK